MATKPLELDNLGSLITIRGTDPPQCLGNLMHFQGRGTFDPEHGLVDVTPEQADLHNRALDEAMVKGLLENCEIGQGGVFYLTEKDGRSLITTFTGTVMATDVRLNSLELRNKYGGRKLSVEFRVGGKVFKGRNNGDDQLVRFKRIK